jgi:hypothetical protein
VDKVLLCHCGFEACAADEEGLVVEVQRHAWEAHAMRLTAEDALLLALRVQLDPEAPTEIPREPERSGDTSHRRDGNRSQDDNSR